MRELFWCAEYIASFIETVMCCYFCGTFIARNELHHAKVKIGIASVIAATITYILNHSELFSYLNTIVFILSCIVTQWLCFKKKFLLSIGLVPSYLVLLCVIDYITIYLISFITDTEASFIVEEQSFVRLGCILLSKSILMVVVIVLNRLFSKEKLIPTRYIIIMGMTASFLVLSNLVLAKASLEISNEKISSYMMIFFLASFGIEVVVFLLVIKIAEGYEQKQANLLIELNNKMLQKSLEETEQTFALWRQSIHDYKNNIIALTQLAEEEKIDEIKDYLQKEASLIDKKMFYTKTGNAVVDTIVNTKQNIAEKQNIVFTTNIFLPKNMVISDLDMANILGNLLDNALEAEAKEDAPYINVTIKQEKNFLIINIKNKCTTLKTTEQIKTTKIDAAFHGIGLKSIKRLVKEYGGEISLDIKAQEFVANILIPNKVN